MRHFEIKLSHRSLLLVEVFMYIFTPNKLVFKAVQIKCHNVLGICFWKDLAYCATTGTFAARIPSCDVCRQ